jgi:hypothetical protein
VNNFGDGSSGGLRPPEETKRPAVIGRYNTLATGAKVRLVRAQTAAKIIINPACSSFGWRPDSLEVFFIALGKI